MLVLNSQHSGFSKSNCCAADEFWKAYDGFGQRHLSFAWPEEKGQTKLHEAAAFGNPDAAQQLLFENPECWEFRTSKGRTAHEVAQDGVAWCKKNSRPREEQERHAAVAELCRRAEMGEAVPPPDPACPIANIGPPIVEDKSGLFS